MNRDGKTHQKLVVAVLLHLHDGRLVSAAIAVIRSRPDRDDVVVEHPLVALHRQLMRSHDAAQSVLRIELRQKGTRRKRSTLGPFQRDNPHREDSRSSLPIPADPRGHSRASRT